MKRRYLPDVTVFERYAPDVSFRLIKKYHQRLAGKYHWFVFPYLSSDRPYYIDGELSDVIADADYPVLEVVNCDWIPQEWDKTAWKYNVNEYGYTEVYCSERTDPHCYGYNVHEIGYRHQPEGVWTLKTYKNKEKSAWIDRRDGWLRVRNGSMIYYWNGHEHLAGKYNDINPVQEAPTDVITPVVRGMVSKKWRGFYTEDVEYILQKTGIRRTRI